jgi:tetratricopeptide (TPR) repeat protein
VLLTSQEAKLRAQEAAMKALALDSTLAEAHAMVAFLRGQHDWDWAGAEAGYKRAIELNPGSSAAHGWYGMHLGMIGRLDESVAELKRALELDPLSIDVNLNLGRVFYFRRQYEQAIEQLQKTRDMDPNFSLARLYLGLAYEQEGIYEEAIAEFRRLATTDFPDTRLFLAHALALSGKRAQALKALDETEFAKAGKVRPWSMAALYTALGDKDQAFAWLQKACDERFIILASVKVDPVFDPLRSDPRFRNLLGRLGLPP